MFLPGSRPALDPERAIKPGRHGLSAETVAEIQRGRLIDGFVQVTAEHGYPKVTISMVTEAAGVTKKAFYVHFTSLDECFLAAYRQGVKIISDRLAEAWEGAPGVPEGIEAALRVLLDTLSSEPLFARAAVVEINAAGPSLRAARAEGLRALRRFFADPGVDIAPVPEPIADAIVTGVLGTIALRLEAGEADRLPDLLPCLTYFMLLPLIGEKATDDYMSSASG